MSDSVTNAYGKTDAFGKGNLRGLLSGAAISTTVRDFYNAHYGMTDIDWTTLFGENNPVYDTNKSSTPFTPIGSLLKQTTISDNTVELITADVVIQVMKKLEKAMQISTNAYNILKTKLSKIELDSSNNALKIITNSTELGDVRVNKFNSYIIKQLETTRVQCRYIVLETYLDNFSIGQVLVHDEYGTQITLTDSMIHASSTHNDTYHKSKIISGYYGANAWTNSTHCWHSRYNEKRKPKILNLKDDQDLNSYIKSI
jgi:hypothetical protein